MATLLLIILASGCATGRDTWPFERLDPHTAVTTTIMAEPWVYAREVPALAANARDYLNVGLVETNRAGQRAYWFGVVAWSTIDRSALPTPARPLGPGRIRLNWPDDFLQLEPVTSGRVDIGASEPVFAPAQAVFQDAWYGLSSSQLVRLAREPPLSIELLGDDRSPVNFGQWQARPRLLESFLEATGFAGSAR